MPPRAFDCLKMLSGYMPPQQTLDFDLQRIIRESPGGNGSSDKSSICETPKYGDFLHLPHSLEGYFDYEQGLKCAKEQNKPIFIDFTGHGCVNCREMEANVWSSPRVLEKLRNEHLLNTEKDIIVLTQKGLALLNPVLLTLMDGIEKSDLDSLTWPKS